MWFIYAIITLLFWAFADLFYKKGAKENDKYRVTAKEGAWKTSTGKPISTVGCFNCKYQSCPKRLAAYILYLYVFKYPSFIIFLTL